MWMLHLAAGGMLGFLAGLLANRVRNRWCPYCGRSTITAMPSQTGSDEFTPG